MPGIPGMPSFGLDTLWSVGKTSLKNKVGQKVLGAIATSPFGDYEAEYKAAIRGETKKETFGEKCIGFIKNYLTAWGYLAIIPGLLIKWIRHKLYPTPEDRQGSILDNLFALAGNVLFYGGPIAAFIGQILPFQKAFALGERKLWEMQRAEMDREDGQKVFDDMDVNNDIHKPAEKLKNTLTYVRHVHAAIFNRSDGDTIETAFVHGPSGTGKTTGATVILSNWARKKVEKKGFEPKARQLNLRVLEDRADKLRQATLDQAELLGSASKDLGDIVKNNIGDPLMGFENLISDIETEIKENESQNKKRKESGQKEIKLAFFIDEYDKIGTMARKSTDTNRLVRVITRLNSLIDQKKVPVILTSNKSIKQIGDDLRAVLSEDLWKTVVEPHLRRLQNKEIFIDEPAPKEQAEILAKYLLDKFPKELLDIKIGDYTVNLTDNRVENIYALREPILAEISSQYGSDRLAGSHLERVAISCLQSLSSRADEMREAAEVQLGPPPDIASGSTRLGYTDAQWEDLSGAEKAKAAGIKLEITKLKQQCRVEQERRVEAMSIGDDPGYAAKHKQGLAKGIAKAFIRQSKARLAPFIPDFLKGKISNDGLLELLGKIYTVSSGVYSSYDDVSVKVGNEEKLFKHCIRIDQERGRVQIGYVNSARDIRDKKGFEALGGTEISDEMPLDIFMNEFLNEIFLMYGKPKNTNFFKALVEFSDMLKSGGQIDPDRVAELCDGLGLNVSFKQP